MAEQAVFDFTLFVTYATPDPIPAEPSLAAEPSLSDVRSCISRKDATVQGLVRYFTGKPCKHGHIAERFTTTSWCVECSVISAKIRADGYARKDAIGLSRQDAKDLGLTYYFDKNSCKNGHISKHLTFDAVCYACKCEAAGVYKAKHPEQKKASDAAWYLANKDRANAGNAAWFAGNRDRKLEKGREWHEVNKDSVSERHKENHRRRPELKKASKARRRARLKAASGSHTPADIRDIYKLQKGKCAYCKKSLKLEYRVDHIIPFFLGGTNDRSNLQLTCNAHNLQKSYLDPIDFARRIGFLI